MKSEKEIKERLHMWLTILENMEKHDTEEADKYLVKVRIYEYAWILSEEEVKQ